MPKLPGVRFPRREIVRVGDILIAAIRPHISRVCYTGSYRRGAAECGDADVLCIPIDSKAASAAFARLCDGGRLESGSGDGLDIGCIDKIPLNLFYTTEAEWGAALMYSTGSRQYNVCYRAIAKKRGLTVNEYGVFRGSICLTTGPSERAVCRAIGIPWLPPNERISSAFGGRP